MKAIIPCAGFGTRMNMKPNESKEMLVLLNENQPVIKYSLNLCKKYNISPLIISRKEKIDLNQYLDKHNIDYIIVEPGKEWPDTILKSRDNWEKNNIMILPDTRFNPTSILKKMKEDMLLGSKYSIALHKVNDSSKWCIVENYSIIEKPSFNKEAFAMGLIAFKDDEGYSLFSRLSSRGSEFKLTNTSFQYLKSFEDITRVNLNGK